MKLHHICALLVLSTLAASFIATQPIGANIHGSPSAACPYGTSGVDGCTNAPMAGLYTVQISNFFTGYAQQTSQTWVRPALLNWNVPGVNYPVGPNTSTLVDPATASGTAAMTSNCTWNASRQDINCNGGSSLTINGVDFSGVTGGHSVSASLAINSTVAGPCLIENSYFKWNNGYAAGAGGGMINVTGCTSLAFVNNKVDGTGNIWAVATGQGQYLLDYNPQSSTTGVQQATFQYNAFLGCPARCVEAGLYGNFTWDFNYVEGMVYGSVVNYHGEPFFVGVPVGETLAALNVDYNTYLEPANVSSGGTALVTPVELGANCLTCVVTTTNVYHNVEVANLTNSSSLSGSGLGTMSVAGVGLYYANYGTVNLGYNFIDPTGSLYCFVNSTSQTGGANPTTVNFTTNTNVDLVNGSYLNAFDSGANTCFGSS